MEIYKSTTPTVTLELPEDVHSSGGIDVDVVENNTIVYSFDVVARSVRGYSVTLPWALTRQDRDLTIYWSFPYIDAQGVLHQVRETTYIQIVTPILSITEVGRLADFDLTTDTGIDDATELERRVRYAVQGYAMQNFGLYADQISIIGTGNERLNLPAPLVEFRGVIYDGILRPNFGVSVINDGWTLKGGQVTIDSIKQAPPEWMLDRFDYQGKIRHPYVYGDNLFLEGIEYVVDGMWGYRDVPGDVRQAARLLVNDYSCDESLWRERYIDSMRAGDWRFEFNAEAFKGTGNAQADQILLPYRRHNAVVI